MDSAAAWEVMPLTKHCCNIQTLVSASHEGIRASGFHCDHLDRDATIADKAQMFWADAEGH